MCVQSLQNEVHRLQEANQQLHQRLNTLSETKRGHTETDWKRLDTEKQASLFTSSNIAE